MSITYKAIDPESGIRWCVRIVFEGDDYGLNHCLTHDETEPMIEFYDMDSEARIKMSKSGDKTVAYLAEEYGQFVSRYYYSTLKMRDPLGKGSALTDWSERGLCLHGGVDGWSVSSEFMVKAMAAINNELEERAEIERREVEDA